MNVIVLVFLRNGVESFVYMPRSCISGSYYSLIYSCLCLTNLQIVSKMTPLLCIPTNDVGVSLASHSTFVVIYILNGSHFDLM